jgi:dienelactone hydrolase
MNLLRINTYTTTCITFLMACGFTGLTQAQDISGEIAEAAAPYISIDQTLPESDTNWQIHLVQTRDEIYVPIGVRKPEGDGPFPMILIGSGQGRDGILKIEQSMDRFQELMGRLVDRGYVAAFVNFRNEVPFYYNEIAGAGLLEDNVSGSNRTLQSVSTLDSDDYLSIVEHAKALPYTDPNGIGAIGSSHSGEIILKGTAVVELGAAVPAEPAAIEYLGMDISNAPRDASGRELQMQDVEAVKSIADKESTMRRTSTINTPLLVIGRDTDHLQGIFRLSYEWIAEAGKDVTWKSFDHPEHGFALLGKVDGQEFEVDKVQEEVFALYMEFFDEHLK